MTDFQAARDDFVAAETELALLLKDPDCPTCQSPDPYRPDCRHTYNDAHCRDALIDPSDTPEANPYTALADGVRIYELVNILLDNAKTAYRVETITQMYLQQSLCPIHQCDYAICFDDEDPGCDQIRRIHPDHDS